MENDISPFFIIKKLREGAELRMDQKYIKIIRSAGIASGNHGDSRFRFTDAGKR